MKRAHSIQEIFRPSERRSLSYTIHDDPNTPGERIFYSNMHLPSGVYEIELIYTHNVQELDLMYTKDDKILSSHQAHLRSYQQITREKNDLIKVFSTIVQMIHEIQKTHHISRITFIGNMDEPKKIHVYDRLVRSLAKQFHGSPSIREEPLEHYKYYTVILSQGL